MKASSPSRWPAPALMVLSVVLLCISLPVSHASPLFLLKQRAGKAYAYEAHRGTEAGYESLLPNSSYTYLYSPTAEANRFIAALFSDTTRYTSGSTAATVFTNCEVPSAGTASEQDLARAGCFKALLHAGIAGDCPVANPLCCVLYWRYPASIADNLSAAEIDPQLVFWDGSQAVNGFFANFSAAYRTTFSDCTAVPTWPQSTTTAAADGVALAVDSVGEWRFTRRRQPTFSLVEYVVTTPDATQEGVFSTLRAAGERGPWASLHPFGNIPLVAPVITSAGLLLLCLLLLVIGYVCVERPTHKTQAELQLMTLHLEAASIVKEREIEKRRQSSGSGSARPSANNSFSRQPKVSPSPVVLQRSPSAPSRQPSQMAMSASRRASVGPSPSPTPTPHPQQLQAQLDAAAAAVRAFSTPAGPSWQESQRQLSRADSAVSRRASIAPEQRRRPSRQNSQSQLQRGGSNVSQLSRSGSVVARVNSLEASARRSPQSFENPLIGRQTFR